MLIVEEVAGVALDVKIVSVEFPEPATVAGTKVGVAPAGSPLALNATFPVKPPAAVMVTANLVLPPPPEVCVPGVALIAKSGTDAPMPPAHDESPKAIANTHSTQAVIHTEDMSRSSPLGRPRNHHGNNARHGLTSEREYFPAEIYRALRFSVKQRYAIWPACECRILRLAP